MTPDSSGARAPSQVALFLVLGLVAAFGPLTMDFYLPGLPSLAADFHTGPAMAQLTISLCLLGLAVGQLVSGVMSDRYGRRRPLLAGLALFVLASACCALAPTIEVLLTARLLQGVGGAAGIVASRAIVADLFTGPRMAPAFSRLNVVTAVVPVIAPIVGGGIILLADWRWVFVVLACIGAGLLSICALVVPESLHSAERTGRGPSQIRAFRQVLRDVQFLKLALVLGVGNSALHAYISLGVLVLQGQWGLSPQQFAWIYALNATGMVLASQANVLLLRRIASQSILRFALTTTAASGAALVVLLAFDLTVPLLLVPVFVTVASQGLVLPNATALALERPLHAGSAAATLGVSQFLLGAIVPPLASMLGRTGEVMGLTIFSCATLAVLLLGAARRAPRSAISS